MVGGAGGEKKPAVVIHQQQRLGVIPAPGPHPQQWQHVNVFTGAGASRLQIQSQQGLEYCYDTVKI